jgi:hypothetical protein
MCRVTQVSAQALRGRLGHACERNAADRSVVGNFPASPTSILESDSRRNEQRRRALRGRISPLGNLICQATISDHEEMQAFNGRVASTPL